MSRQAALFISGPGRLPGSQSQLIPRILLVDDDAADRMAVLRALGGAGFGCEVVECESAGEALAHAAEGHFDCVLLDFLLPGVTALELLPHLRELLPDVGFVILTAHGDARIAVDLMKAGVNDYIAKDRLDADLLVKTLCQTMSLSEARTRLDRATRAGEQYTAKLRELVEATPGLYRGVRLEDRLSAAVRIARTLLDGSEAFVTIRGEDGIVDLLTRGDTVVPAGSEGASWRSLLALADTTDTASQPVTHGAVVNTNGNGPFAPALVKPDPDPSMMVHCVLRGADGTAIGHIGVRCPRPPLELGDAYAALLAQLGQTTVAAVENLSLYETARKAVASRDAVMAVVSHDLRQPLSAFALGLELLGDGTTGAETKVVVGRMTRSSRHMKRLIDDLLDVVRIDGRTLFVTPQLEPLAPIFDEVRDLVGPLAEHGGVRLVVTSPPPIDILAERHRIVQVLANLLGNAISSTPRAGTVELFAHQQPDEILLSVRDSGHGIDPAQLASLFERRSRPSGQGLGLGLFIAKAVVDAHGGRIWAESKVGVGSTFTLAIPVAGHTAHDPDARPEL